MPDLLLTQDTCSECGGVLHCNYDLECKCELESVCYFFFPAWLISCVAVVAEDVETKSFDDLVDLQTLLENECPKQCHCIFDSFSSPPSSAKNSTDTTASFPSDSSESSFPISPLSIASTDIGGEKHDELEEIVMDQTSNSFSDRPIGCATAQTGIQDSFQISSGSCFNNSPTFLSGNLLRNARIRNALMGDVSLDFRKTETKNCDFHQADDDPALKYGWIGVTNQNNCINPSTKIENRTNNEKNNAYSMCCGISNPEDTLFNRTNQQPIFSQTNYHKIEDVDNNDKKDTFHPNGQKYFTDFSHNHAFPEIYIPGDSFSNHSQPQLDKIPKLVTLAFIKLFKCIDSEFLRPNPLTDSVSKMFLNMFKDSFGLDDQTGCSFNPPYQHFLDSEQRKPKKNASAAVAEIRYCDSSHLPRIAEVSSSTSKEREKEEAIKRYNYQSSIIWSLFYPAKIDLINDFDSLCAPSISITDYVKRLFTLSAVDSSRFVSSLCLVQRLICFTKGKLQFSSLSAHRFLLTSIFISTKFFHDAWVSTAFYAEIGGVSSSDIVKHEEDFTRLIGFRLFVSVEQFRTACLVATSMDQILTCLKNKDFGLVKSMFTPNDCGHKACLLCFVEYKTVLRCLIKVLVSILNKLNAPF